MIEGIGRMVPVTPVLGEAQAATNGTAAGQAVASRNALAAQVSVVADLSLGRLVADMAAGPPVDTAKVAMLRDAIASGSYRADPVAIADAMIAQAGDDV